MILHLDLTDPEAKRVLEYALRKVAFGRFERRQDKAPALDLLRQFREQDDARA